MKKIVRVFPMLLLVGLALFTTNCKTEDRAEMYSGSAICRECHERFYELWAPSHHGLAMQGIDSTFIQNELTFSDNSAEIQNYKFEAVNRGDSLIIIETKDNTAKEYPILHALGGKYIYYFLTPFENGKLQVVPLAYDLKAQQWYNNPASAVRHFVDPVEDEELDWKNFAYTFNTSCHSCHVSQLENNYDHKTSNYRTTWREAGINCETCHGPSQEHVDVCKKAKEGETPEDLKLIITSTFTQKSPEEL